MLEYVNRMVKSGFPVKGWKWIFYIIGLVFGILNPIFWFFAVIIHFKRDKGKKFFSNNFHEWVVNWGIFVTIISIIYLALDNIIIGY